MNVVAPDSNGEGQIKAGKRKQRQNKEITSEHKRKRRQSKLIIKEQYLLFPKHVGKCLSIRHFLLAAPKEREIILLSVLAEKLVKRHFENPALLIKRNIYLFFPFF